MLPFEFWESQALIRTLYSHCIESVCEKHGLTHMELDILLFLANNPPFDTASDIVERRRLTKSHVSTSIKSLEQKGLLSKSYALENRKSVHLSLCPAASGIVSDGQAAQKEFFSIIFKDFQAEERAKLEELLSRIAANATEHFTNRTP